MPPLISVLIPVHNAARTVKAAIQSILEQTLGSIEVIVVDDGSTDQTLGIVENIRDSRLKIVSKHHQGVADAANLGLDHCQSEWIARMDADDISLPDRLERQMELIAHGGLDVVASQVKIVGPDGLEVPGMRRYQNWINQETLTSEDILAFRFVELPVVNPTILARRSFFGLGYRSGDFPEDYDLFLRAAHAGFRFGKVAKVLLHWNDHSERLTRRHENYSHEAFDRCRRFHLLKGPLAGCKQVDLWGVGQTGKNWMQWMGKENIRIRNAYDISPRRIGETIHGCLVRPIDDLAKPDGTPLLIAVGKQGAGELIRPVLVGSGYRCGDDAWFVA